MKYDNIELIKVAESLVATIESARSYSTEIGCAHARDGIWWIEKATKCNNQYIDVEFKDENDVGGFRIIVHKNVLLNTKHVFAEASANYEERFKKLCKNFGVSLS